MNIKIFMICVLIIFFFGIHNIGNAFASVVEQPQQVNTQPVSSGNPLLDIWNDPNKSAQDFLNANDTEMEYQKKLSDPNYISKEDAKRRLNELEQWKKEHPQLSTINNYLNITTPYEEELNLKKKYGNKAPVTEVKKIKVKQAGFGIYWALLVAFTLILFNNLLFPFFKDKEKVLNFMQNNKKNIVFTVFIILFILYVLNCI